MYKYKQDLSTRNNLMTRGRILLEYLNILHTEVNKE